MSSVVSRGLHHPPHSRTGMSSDPPPPPAAAAPPAPAPAPAPDVVLVAKFGKERIELPPMPPSTTLLQVKEMLTERTSVLPKRQKILGLSVRPGAPSGKKVGDSTRLEDLRRKGGGAAGGGAAAAAAAAVVTHQFILMGTPEEGIFVDPSEREGLPEVVDDFDLDFNAGSDEWLRHVANEANLRDFTERTAVHLMNEPREGFPLLVLDLDHTLLDFSSRRLRNAGSFQEGEAQSARMKRPFMDEFLAAVHRRYDLVVWSQTSWRWLETKLIELGMLAHPGYGFCFVLDKTSMFKITSTRRGGERVEHSVKPLQLVWSKFPGRWGSHNTVHLDDLARNFALNLGCGLKCTAYHRKRRGAKKDVELLALARYLDLLAGEGMDFEEVDFADWASVSSGKKSIRETAKRKQKEGGGEDQKKKKGAS